MGFATPNFISQKSSLLLFSSFLAILQVTKIAECATSELVVYFCIMCRSRDNNLSVMCWSNMSGIPFSAESNNHNHAAVRPAGEEV